MHRLRVPLLASFLFACAPPPPVAAPSPPIASSAAPHDIAPSIRVTASAPAKVDFDATALGRNDALVRIQVTNDGAAPVALGRLGIAFRVSRASVTFACRPIEGGGRDLDAATLRPGETFTMAEPLGCWTPLPGAYEGLATVSLTAGGRLREVPFRFELADPHGHAARPYVQVNGLYVLAGADTRTLPVGASAPDDRADHAVLILVNGGTEPLSVPPARVKLVVSRVGDPLPCAGESALRPVPEIPPGDAHVERIPITCLRDRAGDYDVDVLVSFAEGTALEAGRLRVRVTSDMDVNVPIPRVAP